MGLIYHLFLRFIDGFLIELFGLMRILLTELIEFIKSRL